MNYLNLKISAWTWRSLVQLPVRRNASPVSDEIKQREAFRWLKTLGYEPNFLEKLEKEGLVHKKRKGSSRNSPIIYSKFEIQSAINAFKMSKYLNK